MELNEVIAELIRIRDESSNFGTFEVVCAEEGHFYEISSIVVDMEMAEVRIS